MEPQKVLLLPVFATSPVELMDSIGNVQAAAGGEKRYPNDILPRPKAEQDVVWPILGIPVRMADMLL
jgi:hypothetical protein